MKNKPITSLSVRKFLLTALVAGPLATLPAPLWALPGSTSANVSTTAGVSFQIAGSTLNVTAPDKAILTWTAFGDAGANAIAAGQIVNYIQPAATSAVLNRVTTGATTIDGAITANGKVFILNPNGITVSNTASFNVASLVLSTVQEPDGYFAANGALSFVGTSTNAITVGAAGAPNLSTIGGGGDIWLVGTGVDIGATVSGNLYVRSLGGATNLSQGSILAVNATSGVGGNLDVATAGGALDLGQGFITNVKGNANLVTTNGNVITTTASGFVVNQTGKSTTINAGTGTITLKGDSVTVSAIGGNTLITDANDLALGASTIGGTLGVTSTAGHLSNTGAVTSTGAVSLTTSGAGKNITVSTTGAVTFATLSSNAGKVTITGTGNLTLPAVAGTDLSATTTGGTITAGAALTQTASTTLSASGNVILTGNIGDTPTISVTSTGGNITQVGTITNTTGVTTIDARTVTLGSANDFTTLVLKNGANGITIADANAIVLGTGTNTTGATTIGAATNITLGAAAGDTLAFGGTLALTSAGGAIATTANTVSSTGDVTLTTAGGNATLGTAAPVSTAFGKINAAIGAGTLTVRENVDTNLGTITAANLSAKSLAGNIVNNGVVTVSGTATLEAGTSSAPGNITLGQSNAIATTSITRAFNFTLKNTVPTTVGTTNPVTGTASFQVAANNLTVTGDYATVGYTASGAAVISITDANAMTLANVTHAGTGTTTITSTTSDLTLGAGINITTSGLSTFASTAGNVVDSVDTGVSVFDAVQFNAGLGVNVSHLANNFGAVNVTATSGNISLRENGTLKLGTVTSTAANKNLTAISDTADITQTGATTSTGTGTATFTANNGAVTITNAGNAITSTIQLTAKNASAVTNAAGNNVKFGNSSVSTAGLTVNASGAGTITQASGTTLWIYGAPSFNTAGGVITLANSGNNFGGLTIISGGGNVSIKEGGTTNIVNVNTTGGTFTAVSEAGSFIDTANLGTIVGGATSLTASAGSITLDATGNAFTGDIAFSSGANVYLLDSAGGTQLTTGSSAVGTLTVKNTANLAITSTGPISSGGATLFDAGTGSIILNNVSNSFGALSFKAGAAGVTIVQNSDMSLAAGSAVTGGGAVILTSYGRVLTSGTGGSNLSGTFTINATGTITFSNSWYISGLLTLNSPGAKDITVLSLAGNLNNTPPVSTGGGVMTGPTLP